MKLAVVQHDAQTGAIRPKSALVRVSHARPCPICHHADWCSAFADGTAVICMRVESGSVARTNDGGFIHRVSATPITIGAVTPKPTRHDLVLLARNYQSAINPARLLRLASSLGLGLTSLHRLGIGWAFDA